MKLLKVRLPDGNMSIFDVSGQRRLKTGEDVIVKGHLLATKINGEWRRSARDLGANEPVGIFSQGPAALDALPVALDMAPGKIYAYLPKEIEVEGELKTILERQAIDTEVENESKKSISSARRKP